MVDEINVYISAAPELARERDLLGRLIAEIPVTLGWRIVQTPTKEEPVDVQSIKTADIHLLVMGSDIRAPVGFEYLTARRSSRHPWLFLKQGVLRTTAGQDFIRRLGDQGKWKKFKHSGELRQLVEQQIAEHIIARSSLYNIQGKELERFIEWKNELEKKTEFPVEDDRRGAGESGVIISPERYIPREGVLLHPQDSGASDEGA